jgi:hypothetical protein
VSAAEKALAALEAAGKAATPRPWSHMGRISQSAYPYDDVVSVEESRGWETTSNLNLKDEDADLICRAVNLSAPLAAVARAAMAHVSQVDANDKHVANCEAIGSSPSSVGAVRAIKTFDMLKDAIDAFKAAAKEMLS